MKGALETVRSTGAGLFFAVAAVLALLAGITVYSFMRAAVRTETVVTVARNLPPGTTLRDKDLVTRTVPAGAAPEQAVREPAQVVGQRLRYGVVAGAPLQGDLFVASGGDLAHQVAELGEDLRMVMIPADLVPAPDRLVPGDRLELTAVFPYTDGKAATLVTIPLGTATVLDIPGTGRETERNVVLVAVSPEQASQLALTQRSGTLMVSLLGHGTESPPAPALRLDALVNDGVKADQPGSGSAGK